MSSGCTAGRKFAALKADSSASNKSVPAKVGKHLHPHLGNPGESAEFGWTDLLKIEENILVLFFFIARLFFSTEE